MPINIDASVSTVASRIEKIYDDHYGDSYKLRKRGPKNRKIVKVMVDSGEPMTEVKETPDGKTKIDVLLTDQDVVDKIEQEFGTVSGESRSVERRGRSKDKSYKEESVNSSSRSGGDSIELVGANNDGSITVMPPFTKEEASYHDTVSSETHKACINCAHYVSGGGCTLVQGEIKDWAHCDEFYADVGLFGNNVNDVELNLKLWGEKYDFSREEISEFVGLIKSAMESK